jgi:hypothetical protein
VSLLAPTCLTSRELISLKPRYRTTHPGNQRDAPQTICIKTLKNLLGIVKLYGLRTFASLKRLGPCNVSFPRTATQKSDSPAPDLLLSRNCYFPVRLHQVVFLSQRKPPQTSATKKRTPGNHRGLLLLTQVIRFTDTEPKVTLTTSPRTGQH